PRYPPLSRVIPSAPPPPSTLSLHDALPIYAGLLRWRRHETALCDDRRSDAAANGRALEHSPSEHRHGPGTVETYHRRRQRLLPRDRKSTRLNSSHGSISYAVFCLKKKKINV